MIAAWSARDCSKSAPLLSDENNTLHEDDVFTGSELVYWPFEMSSTDTADEIVEIGLSPPKKRAKKRHFDASTKEMILNIYKCEVNEKPGSTVNDGAIKVANKSGVCGEVFLI
ncbi:hypothetical protein ILUMI_12715 [Ignelater luminosus]|uniref:Uncharacterized protein n=1 Tax=Ignelater luminosus TaxID=2038154 RepID=A0A8K0D290_IGNLU|nr:hypothetical protein ILUMI_12715 [Ignelater luminosus]